MFLALLLAASAVAQDCSRTAEHSALLDFAAATAGADWATPWPVATADHCSWPGVSCSGRCVASLELPAQGLRGAIPTEALAALVHLVVLDLSDNLLFGALPALDGLNGLQVVNLDQNAFTGSIPASYGGLADLLELDLSDNSLSGSLPATLTALARLQALYLDQNAFDGELPADIGRLAELRAVSLWGCAFSGSLPPSLSALTKAIYILVRRNEIEGSLPPELGRLTGLEFFWADDNMISGTLPSSLASLVGLERIWLHDNALSGSIPPAIVQLSDNLVDLSLASNLLTHTIPSDIGDMSALTTLNLDTNALSGSLPSSLGRLSLLERIDLHDNLFTGALPLELGGLTSLRGLYLSNNAFSGSLPASMARMVALEYLYLDDCRFTGSIPDYLGNFPLNIIQIGGNEFEGALPSSFGRLHNLTLLDIKENRLTSLPGSLGALSRLRLLDASDNLVTGLPVAWMGPDDSIETVDGRLDSATHLFASLTVVRLDGNPLGAEMDLALFLRVFKAWQSLGVITCAGCGLRGALDELLSTYGIRSSPGSSTINTFSAFNALVQIDLSNNAATGSLPAFPPRTLLTFAASNTLVTGELPSPWLGMSLLALDNTTVVAGDSTWRNMTTVSSSETTLGTYTCRTVLGTDGRVLIVDPLFVDFAICDCIGGHSGAPPACAACPIDTYRDRSLGAGAACEPCPPHSTTLGATGISAAGGCECTPGFVHGPLGCEACEPGQFSAQDGALVCGLCPEGTFSDRGAQGCFPCPSVGVSCAGGMLLAQDGFWRSTPDGPITADTEFLPCTPPSLCRIDPADQRSVVCAKGHAGVLCAECADGFARFDNRCFRCWSRGGSIFLVVLAAVIFFSLMWAVVTSTRRGKSTGSVVLKIFSNHLQCLLIILRFGWPGPEVFADATRVLALSTGSDLSLGMLFPLKCAAQTGYYAEQAVVLMLPFVTIALTWVLILLLRQPRQAAVDRCILAGIVIMFQTHSMIMRRVAAFFECQEVDSRRRHTADFGTVCSGPTYDTMLVLNTLAVVFLVFGVPLAGLLAVRRAAFQGTLSERKTITRLGYLYVGYRLPDNLGKEGRGGVSQMHASADSYARIGRTVPTQYWEGVVFLRKLALVGCATLLGPIARGALRNAESDQSALALAVLLVALAAHCLVQPFDRPELNAIETLSLLALAGTVVGGVAQGPDAPGIGAVAGVAHLLFVCGCIGYLVQRAATRRVGTV